MAEFMFKNMLRKEYLEDCFLVESKATNTWGIGNPVNPDARKKLLSVGIDPGRKRSSLLKKEDFESSDARAAFLAFLFYCKERDDCIKRERAPPWRIGK